MSKLKLRPVGLALAFALLFTALGAGVALAVQSHMVDAPAI